MENSRTLAERVLALGETCPDKLALAFRKDQLTYGGLSKMVRCAAGYMRELGVKGGDRVLYTAVSKPQTFIFYLACQFLGAAAVPTDRAGIPDNEISLYKDADASLLITALKHGSIPEECNAVTQKAFLEECSKRAEAGRYEEETYVYAGGEAISDILFTSGTTGKPKGVMLSCRAVLSILKNTKNGLRVTSDDVVLMPLPLHHSLALRVSRAVLFAGATLVLQNGFVFAKETENNQASFGCTGFAAVPVSMELLRSQMQDQFYDIMGRFRFIEIGAGALTVEQRKRLAAKLPDTRITNTWGSSETGGVLFADVHEVVKSEERVSTLGRPIEGAEIAILGDVYD
ncbi:MAG: class I adenylate-forming enzyme family protein, partial [Lachnospiraceae bacterium]|nr:class I adenylate-forming enzyme family protein [Lachnospiraceae bacterium]